MKNILVKEIFEVVDGKYLGWRKVNKKYSYSQVAEILDNGVNMVMIGDIDYSKRNFQDKFKEENPRYNARFNYSNPSDLYIISNKRYYLSRNGKIITIDTFDKNFTKRKFVQYLKATNRRFSIA